MRTSCGRPSHRPVPQGIAPILRSMFVANSPGATACMRMLRGEVARGRPGPALGPPFTRSVRKGSTAAQNSRAGVIVTFALRAGRSALRCIPSTGHNWACICYKGAKDHSCRGGLSWPASCAPPSATTSSSCTTRWSGMRWWWRCEGGRQVGPPYGPAPGAPAPAYRSRVSLRVCTPSPVTRRYT